MASATVSAERKMPGPISHWPRPRSDPTSRPSASTTSAVAATPAQVRCHQPAKTPNLASPPTSRTAPKVTRPTTLRDRGAGGAGGAGDGSGRSQANGAAPSGSHAGGVGSAGAVCWAGPAWVSLLRFTLLGFTLLGPDAPSAESSSQNAGFSNGEGDEVSVLELPLVGTAPDQG